jgi:hypothetical protein
MPLQNNTFNQIKKYSCNSYINVMNGKAYLLSRRRMWQYKFFCCHWDQGSDWDGENSCTKMAASATSTPISHISVISAHGSVAGPGSCCAGCVTLHGWSGWKGQWGEKWRVSAVHGIVGRVWMWGRGIGKKWARKWKGKKSPQNNARTVEREEKPEE